MDKLLIKEILNFRDERNWKQFHNAKDLAISLNLEASELLETFQWLSNEEAISKNKEEMSEELADILMYCILFADAVNFDIEKIIKKKLEINKKKYPVEKAYGKNEKYNKL